MELKLKKGGKKFYHALKDDCKRIDIECGYNSNIPITVFQDIVRDYDLPIVESDKNDLHEKHYLMLSQDHQTKLITYEKLLDHLSPPDQIDFDVYLSLVKRI